MASYPIRTDSPANHGRRPVVSTTSASSSLPWKQRQRTCTSLASSLHVRDFKESKRTILYAAMTTRLLLLSVARLPKEKRAFQASGAQHNHDWPVLACLDRPHPCRPRIAGAQQAEPTPPPFHTLNKPAPTPACQTQTPPNLFHRKTSV